jgi:putative transposase
MSDSLYDGRRFRVLTLVDTMSRESPAIVADTAFSGARVAAVLNRLADSWGLPSSIQVDNGPEFTSRVVDGLGAPPPDQTRLQPAGHAHR